MPRVGRVVLPDYPSHIVQRGHNRQVVSAQEKDFRLNKINLRVIHGLLMRLNKLSERRGPGRPVKSVAKEEKNVGGD